ncbi:hypothetical protein SEUBUCD646_0L02380 [Saccharomyces eubayanus]|uniref:PSP1 C-terminal domain-containing protein n=1 Tax=Saccharomyces eubayanus TaxID=1080349 RepID=A0ABN8VJP3_SACEU|nr:hypothetical protein SEUBUCD650_0L02390 [Saccharomyces eubayanus]CAI1608484.1 hypothetical protein SEUBUCD646_0L02380 [Saccharomyces eubayanus]
MELPSINSTTSISDNQELRNYYDKLLFKNNSGNSLADLPGKLTDFNDKSAAAAHPRSRVDFINGYIGPREDKQSLLGQKNTKRASFSAFTGDDGKQHERISSRNGPNLSLFSFEFNGSPAQERNTYKQDHLNVVNASPNNLVSPLNDNAQKYYPHQQTQQLQLQLQSIFDPGRRSSYIADTLIHGNAAAVQQPQYTRPVYSHNNPSLQVPYTAPSEYAQRQPYSSSFNARRNTQPVVNMHPPPANSNDTGLTVVDGKNLTSSRELHDLYLDCGSNYFASEKVYGFIDAIKETLQSNGASAADSRIIEFLNFLKNCNLNYNPQSDAFTSNDAFNNSSGAKASNSTSMHLHYKPLVLVSLKNGKLELLSKPQTATLVLKRGDLVIIDGDRGKDLVLVVEPVVDVNLALFVNFLKKKIHFDSLITSNSQHFPNDQFVKTLIDTTNGKPVPRELDPKLYDIIELTQLIIPSKQVLRFATPWESSTNLHNKFQDELKALHIAQLKLRSLNNNNSSGGLNIKILNAEFQFDRKKLTFYYICQERNDFRDLIKELFKFYKTRIWLCAIPNNLSIDSKFYDSNKFEWEMYQDMMSHYSMDNAGIVVAPELNRLKLDDFQIGVYMELVKALFG